MKLIRKDVFEEESIVTKETVFEGPADSIIKKAFAYYVEISCPF